MWVRFNQDAVVGLTTGEIDSFDYVDGRPALVPHFRSDRVPRGAPMIVSGWALAPGTKSAPRDVCVVLDGALQLPASTGLVRDDIAEEQNADPAIGYRAVVTTDELTPGPHEVRSYVWGRDERWYEAGFRPFSIYEAALIGLPRLRRPLRMRIERVLNASQPHAFERVKAIPQGHPALVIGWAYDKLRAAGPTGVVAFDHHNRAWSAPVDVMRAALRPHVGAQDERLGFELLIPTDALGRGRHTLRFAAYGEDSRIFEGDTNLTIDVAAPLRKFPFTARETDTRPTYSATLTQTSSNQPDRDGTFQTQLRGDKTVEVIRGSSFVIEGWALDATGRGAADVFVELGYPGFTVSPHRHVAMAGYHQDAETSKCQPAPPVPDGWFFCPFGTRELRAGSFTLDLVVAAPGRQTLARASMGILAVRNPYRATDAAEDE